MTRPRALRRFILFFCCNQLFGAASAKPMFMSSLGYGMGSLFTRPERQTDAEAAAAMKQEACDNQNAIRGAVLMAQSRAAPGSRLASVLLTASTISGRDFWPRALKAVPRGQPTRGSPVEQARPRGNTVECIS